MHRVNVYSYLGSHIVPYQVEVSGRWKLLNVELQTWLEDQWRNRQKHASLQQQFEVGYRCASHSFLARSPLNFQSGCKGIKL